MISYDQFVATIEAEDIRVLNLFAMGQRPTFNDTVEGDAMLARAMRLFDAGLLLRPTLSWEKRDGATWRIFEGFVDPAAAAYLARIASERVLIHRDPLPVA